MTHLPRVTRRTRAEDRGTHLRRPVLVAALVACLLALLPAASLVAACSRTPTEASAPPPGDAARGETLYEQIWRTWPSHNEYDLDHQLLVRPEKPEVVLSLLDLQPGQAVADIGSGSGFYTFRLADAVGPTGRVYAVDVQQKALDYLKGRMADPALYRHGNVELVHNQPDDIGLPAGVLDRGLLCHSDFYAFPTLLDENVRMIASTFRAFKPGGILVVVQDLEAVPTATTRIISTNFLAAGFREREARSPQGEKNLYLSFEKPAS